MRTTALLLICTLPSVVAGSPAAAAIPPPSSASAPQDVFADVYAAITDGTDTGQSLDLAAVAYAQRAIATDPALTRIETDRPGLTADLADALRPVLARVSGRLREAYRPRMIGAVRETFTATEARDIAAFCRTPVGRKLMSGAAAAYDSKATIASALRAGLISPEEARIATEEAAHHAFSELTSEDSTQIGLMAETSPALQKINLLTQRLGALRLAMEAEPLTVREKAAADAAIKTGIAAHAARFRR